MDLEFLVPDANSSGAIRCFDRNPYDASKPLVTFSVELTSHQLTANAQVYLGSADCASINPSSFFRDMADQSEGWPGTRTWESLEGELSFSASHDGLGHISMETCLKSGCDEYDWLAQTVVMVEAGQLEGLARKAAVFFGSTFDPQP